MGELNLFDLSPRELTNSAVWAWILDGLNSSKDSLRQSVANELLKTLNVPVPDEVRVLETERSLPDGRRMDVYLEGVKLGKEFIFFIENKVSHDTAVDSQVAGYLDALSQRGMAVYSAVLSLAPEIRQLIVNSPRFTEENRPAVLDLEQMIGFFSRFNFAEESIHAEFLRHLICRNTRNNRVRNAFVRGGADPEMWLAVARKNGVEELFSEYVNLASQLEDVSGRQLEVKYFNGRSVAVVGKSKRALFALHPEKSKRHVGLWLGYNHVNWLYHFNTDFPVNVLPEDFSDKPDGQQPNWHFGYIMNKQELALFFSATTGILT